MDSDDKKDILNALTALSDRTDKQITALGDRGDKQFTALSDRIDKQGASLGEQIAELTNEVRTGFERFDRRLSRVEEELAALSKTVDSLIEGDTLGTRHITLTREEYDAFVKLARIPNRFA